jgi:hypothetical protein
MRLYIPTFGRADKQETYKNLPLSLRKDAVLVVYGSEADLYGDMPILVVPPTVKGIAQKRQWLLDNHSVKKDGEAIVMLDDDVGFAVRKTDDSMHFRKPTDKDIVKLFGKMEMLLRGGYAQVGVVPREGGHNMHTPSGIIECTRVMRVSGYNVATLRSHDVRFDRVVFMEDFDVTLQLLRLGIKNAVLSGYCQGQGDSNVVGGCHSYRGIEEHNAAATRLHELHPDYVKVVEKETKGSWGGKKRLDVVVSWQKAYSDGVANAGK